MCGRRRRPSRSRLRFTRLQNHPWKKRRPRVLRRAVLGVWVTQRRPPPAPAPATLPASSALLGRLQGPSALSSLFSYVPRSFPVGASTSEGARDGARKEETRKCQRDAEERWKKRDKWAPPSPARTPTTRAHIRQFSPLFAASLIMFSRRLLSSQGCYLPKY